MSTHLARLAALGASLLVALSVGLLAGWSAMPLTCLVAERTTSAATPSPAPASSSPSGGVSAPWSEYDSDIPAGGVGDAHGQATDGPPGGTAEATPEAGTPEAGTPAARIAAGRSCSRTYSTRAAVVGTGAAVLAGLVVGGVTLLRPRPRPGAAAPRPGHGAVSSGHGAGPSGHGAGPSGHGTVPSGFGAMLSGPGPGPGPGPGKGTVAPGAAGPGPAPVRVPAAHGVGAPPAGQGPDAAAGPTAGAGPHTGPGDVRAERAALVRTCVYVRDRSTSEAITDELARALSAVGVRELRPVGVPFDPAQHEAGGSVPTDDPALDGTIAAVEVVGYADRDTVLRAPVVTVYRVGAA